MRDRLEAAGPEERMQLVRELRGRYGDDKLARGLDALARRLELSQAERASFAELSHDERKRKLYELRRREIVERVEREGPPAWIGADEWQAMQQLDDRAFCARLRSCRSDRFEGRDDRDLGELWRLLRPDPQWLEAAESLSESERRSEFERRISPRVLDWLDEHPQTLPELDRAELRALPPREQLQRVRDVWRAGHAPRSPSRDGPSRSSGRR